MQEKEFNLLQEPWIRVMREDCRVEEVSLPDALLHAHEYCGLAGELPTQDAAVLRLLLAVLHAVFERVDTDGEEAAIETADDALDRWEELWNNGQFPEKPLNEYFETQQENFWLFHPTRPFWQIAEIPKEVPKQSGQIRENLKDIPTQSEPVRKLNGVISESGNKKRLFSERSEETKNDLTNAETARWLVCMNQYDDNTLKTKLKVGLLGQFVVLSAKGNTLYETLMFNFVLLNQNGEPWEPVGMASWEQKIKFDEKPKTIAYPSNPVAILSYHSRYGKLERSEGKLDCYRAPKGGICFDSITRNEQMAVWKKDRKKDEYNLLQTLEGKQAWREFGSLITDKSAWSILVNWNSILARNQCIDNNTMLRYEFVEITYDRSFKSSVENIYSDYLKIHYNLLSELGEVYRQRIRDMVERCDKTAENLGFFSVELFLASGGDPENTGNAYKSAQEDYYYAVDIPFRKWLASLDAKDNPELREQNIVNWCNENKKITDNLAEKMLKDAGKPAFIGKEISKKKKNGKTEKKYYCSSMAMLNFKSKMKNLDKI